MTIVDVRSMDEFIEGHSEGSINIPLHEIPVKVQEFKTLNGPIILCCASGNRSGQATAFLKSHGVECINGGSWQEAAIYAQTA